MKSLRRCEGWFVLNAERLIDWALVALVSFAIAVFFVKIRKYLSYQTNTSGRQLFCLFVSLLKPLPIILLSGAIFGLASIGYIWPFDECTPVRLDTAQFVEIGYAISWSAAILFDLLLYRMRASGKLLPLMFIFFTCINRDNFADYGVHFVNGYREAYTLFNMSLELDSVNSCFTIILSNS